MLYTESPYTFRQFWGSEGLNLAIFCSFEISGITLSEDYRRRMGTNRIAQVTDSHAVIIAFFGQNVADLVLLWRFQDKCSGPNIGYHNAAAHIWMANGGGDASRHCHKSYFDSLT